MLHQNVSIINIFLSLLSRIDIHLIAFDEAHCISKGMTLDLAIKVSLKSIHITSKLYNRCINGNSYCRSKQDIMEKLNIDRRDEVKQVRNVGILF